MLQLENAHQIPLPPLYNFYLETFDGEIDLNIENFVIEGYITSYSDKDYVIVSLSYSNENLSYTDGFDYLDDIYSIFNLMKDNILTMDTDKIIQISVALLIGDGIYDCRYIFQSNIEDRSQLLGLELNGNGDDHEVFMENIFGELNNVFSYIDDSEITMLLRSGNMYIHIDSEQDSNNILLDVNSSID